MLGNPGWYFFSKKMCNLPWYWTRKRYVSRAFFFQLLLRLSRWAGERVGFLLRNRVDVWFAQNQTFRASWPVGLAMWNYYNNSTSS